MANLKKVSSAQYGTVEVITTEEKTLLYNFKDICKLFGINYQQARTDINSLGLYEVPVKVDQRKSKKLFIDEANLSVCLRLSTDENADAIYGWLKEIKTKLVTTVGEYTVEDLKDEGVALKVLHRLRELESIVIVQEVKIEEDSMKVKLVDELYGTKVPIDFYLLTMRIKYKGLSIGTILEDLRANGIFNESNLPYQKYIDEKYFRLVTVTTNIKTEEVTVTRVLVYQKGIRLVEDILKKKAGIKNERKRITS